MFSRFLHKHPFLIFLVPLAIGIMGGEIVPETWFRAGCYFIVSIAVILAACYRLPAKHSWIFACLLTLFLAGSGAVLSHQPRPDLPPQGELITLKGRCAKVFAYPDKYAIQSGNTSILLQTPDSTSLSPGDSVMFQAWVFPLAEKQHFHDFDYDKYLFHQKIQAKATQKHDKPKENALDSLTKEKQPSKIASFFKNMGDFLRGSHDASKLDSKRVSKLLS